MPVRGLPALREAALRWAEPRRRPVDGIASPVFVCGCSHSGTTILTRFVGQHPTIEAIRQETAAFCAPHSRRRLVELHHQWTDMATAAGKARYAEKTPDHVFHLDRIFRCFPAAQVVIIERDGRDVVASLRERVGGVASAAQKWQAAIAAGRAGAEDPRVAIVRYEDLVEDPSRTLEAMCRRFGISFEPAMAVLEGAWEWQPRDRGEHGRRRREQVAGPFFDGRGRWRTELSVEDLAECEAVAGMALRQLRYTEP